MLAGRVRPGDTVAVVGAGAVGLSAILTTGLWGASRVIAVDTNKFRLDKARDFGAMSSRNLFVSTANFGRHPHSPVVKMADRPTGQAPTTATVSPGRTFPARPAPRRCRRKLGLGAVDQVAEDPADAADLAVRGHTALAVLTAGRTW